MRYGVDHKFWVVRDPSPEDEIGDVLSLSSLRDLELQFKGGLTATENPTLFTSREDAEAEAEARMERRVAREEKRRGLGDVARIVLEDEDGNPVCLIDLRDEQVAS